MSQQIFACLSLFAAVTTTLVAGFTFTFAVIIMPGIKQLEDSAFIRTFQVIDGIIQGGQPLFGVVWIGSILSTLAIAAIGLFQFDGWHKWVPVAVATVYFVGVQLPTFTINIPRNNRLQTLQVGLMDHASIVKERSYFEATWNRWNVIRTWVALAVSISLMLIFKTT
ncbi:DUF1772 domain-containing protein [Rubellicoccus peritrichatus]|uniref:DUF1772 domain-containing protein n=1 Tax=Rubellicoccus peritrichatus TaxID=3080537 RepID=A0AAQ3LER6_9BACT|nr:DUF1772 domain-containing protein [Puniceicoccus sp. CR14]WOO42595.1 DUF1772 domain-containing protein [Puniceicoccus sp. CR14]